MHLPRLVPTRPSVHSSLAMCSPALANRLQLKALSRVRELLHHARGSGRLAGCRLAPAHPSEQKVSDSISRANLLGFSVCRVLKPLEIETTSLNGIIHGSGLLVRWGVIERRVITGVQLFRLNHAVFWTCAFVFLVSDTMAWFESSLEVWSYYSDGQKCRTRDICFLVLEISSLICPRGAQVSVWW